MKTSEKEGVSDRPPTPTTCPNTRRRSSAGALGVSSAHLDAVQSNSGTRAAPILLPAAMPRIAYWPGAPGTALTPRSKTSLMLHSIPLDSPFATWLSGRDATYDTLGKIIVAEPWRAHHQLLDARAVTSGRGGLLRCWHCPRSQQPCWLLDRYSLARRGDRRPARRRCQSARTRLARRCLRAGADQARDRAVHGEPALHRHRRQPGGPRTKRTRVQVRSRHELPQHHSPCGARESGCIG